jgi:hypothetical protein
VLSDSRGTELGRAYSTLARGSGFLAQSLRVRAKPGAAGLTGAGGAKVVGNGLRELDRFLNLLLDEAAVTILPPDFDHVAFARRHNVASKIGDLYGLAGLAAPDAGRLRAIGRVRACLHHCRGVVHDPLLWDDLGIAAGKGSESRRHDPAERLAVSFGELGRICAFYAQSGDGLVAACRAIAPVP